MKLIDFEAWYDSSGIDEAVHGYSVPKKCFMAGEAYGRGEALLEAAAVVEQCCDADPTLQKLAAAIREL